MNPDNINSDSSYLLWSSDGVNFHKLCEITSVETTFSGTVDISDECAAELWATLNPLEIVKDDET